MGAGKSYSSDQHFSTLEMIIIELLWRCCLGGGKGIRPVKKLSNGVLTWLSVWGEVQICIWPRWYHCSSKYRLVLPFCYQLTWV